MSGLPLEILLQLESEKRELEAQNALNDLRIKQIKEILNRANKSSINWSKLALECIRKNDEPLTTDEILRNIFWNDLEEINDRDRRRKHLQPLSLALNRLCSKGVIVGKPLEVVHGKIYYLKDWENSNGFLTTEYDYIVRQKIFKIKAERLKNLNQKQSHPFVADGENNVVLAGYSEQ